MYLLARPTIVSSSGYKLTVDRDRSDKFTLLIRGDPDNLVHLERIVTWLTILQRTRVILSVNQLENRPIARTLGLKSIHSKAVEGVACHIAFRTAAKTERRLRGVLAIHESQAADLFCQTGD